MPDIQLSDTDQAALRFVLAAEPLPGTPLPPADLLERLAKLVRCDVIGVALADPNGYVVDEVELPHRHYSMLGETVCDGPLYIGVVHWRTEPSFAETLREIGLSDTLSLGFRNGKDHVVQFWWDRCTGQFGERDVAMLRMIAPIMQRLVRDAATPALPASLTVQERRTLMLVAAGFSNTEIAQRLSVATSTVRKHLEHAYRKLGVTNRLAAAVALHGAMLPPSELREKIVALG